MKTIYKSLTKIVFPVVALAALALLPACNDNPDAFELTDGVPVVHYVRIQVVRILKHAFFAC